jgi:hypothetical protein
MGEHEDFESEVLSWLEDNDRLPDTGSLRRQAACNDPEENNTQLILSSNPAPVNHCGEVDFQQAVLFLVRLADGEDVTFQTVRDNKDVGGENLARIHHGELCDYLDSLIELNLRGAGIFAMMNEGDGKGRKAENVLKVRGVFADLDGAPLQPALNAPLRPHMIVETSHGRYHVCWLVDGVPKKRFRSIQAALAKRYGGDPSVTDLSRVMRVPGFYHMKREPFLVTLRECNDHDPYSYDEFMTAMNLDLATDASDYSNQAKVTNGVIGDGLRNNTLASVGGFLRRKGLSADNIESTLVEINRNACEEPLSESEIRNVARSMGRYTNNLTDYPLTDAGNAERLMFRHGNDFHYCPQLGGWMVYKSGRWVRDDSDEIHRRALETVRATREEAKENE